MSFIADPNGSGYVSPNVELEIHPTAVERKTPVVVHSPNTVYTPETITAQFHNRGADVITDSQGQVHVTPTCETYEIKTERKVPKTGYVFEFCSWSQRSDFPL